MAAGDDPDVVGRCFLPASGDRYRALPFVLIFLATARHEHTSLITVGAELVLGLALGSAIAAGAALAWRSKTLTAQPRLQPLGPVGIAVVVYGTCHLTHANPYLAAFAAGSTLATLDGVSAERFEPFGDLLAEVTKYAALLVFGALITPARITHLGWHQWLVPIIAIVAVRPAALLVSLLGSRLPASQRLAAAWFGPKGFASVVYGLLALQSGIAQDAVVFDLVAVTIALSITVHSSTDVPISKMLRVEPPPDLPSGNVEEHGQQVRAGDAGSAT